MRKLKYSNKFKKETNAFAELINMFVTKMNKEYATNMNKLIEMIARGENLDVKRLKDKYLAQFKAHQDDMNQGDNVESITEENTNDVNDINDDVYLDKITINNIDYWYENKDNGKIYCNNVLVGIYKNNDFLINNTE